MSNTIRIRTTPNDGDKYVKVKIDQEFDFIEILSLKISQEDVYKKYCSDYGVIVGRVSVNNGFGVPNAKVSVFIPLDDIDKNNPLIKGLYPYEILTDKNSDGLRYNLLPKDGDVTNECSTPIGSFPNKREILDNETMLSIYCKYYKFTTTTNHAGDYMIFGIPLGTYQVHVDADISDIGIISQRPYDLISQGTPKKLFYSPTKFKESKNLDKLIQVKTLNSGVNVNPFWGDIENCSIGISRVDFDLNYTVVPSSIFMGSIYGDQDKHSVNYRCRPRKKLGNLCEQVAGPGSIKMIRKTFDGNIEDFDVEGGRVIDDDGTWAYQIPMNLDYMVTAEDGSLILSQDQNKGIATRARVRFNIGMDETGGEGRLRTRARYLVPNNPLNAGDVDYTFGPETSNANFRDLHWNKIYSVKNYIPRFQRETNLLPVKSRSMTAIKDVDACAGDKTPFPYNRVNTEGNPIFFIICLIIKIISFLIYIMNSFLIPLINVIIAAINSVIGAIVDVINGIIGAINSVSSLLGITLAKMSWTPIPYIGCIHVECPSDDGSTFAPGCSKGGGLDGGSAWTTANDKTHLTYYSNDGFQGHDAFGSGAGLDDCIAFEMAKSLNMFQFDFYNDWINGSLFGFLLKYKKKKKGREKFCEYDCDDWGIAAGGVDGNGNGVPDNDCHNQLLLDTCFPNSSDKNCQNESYDSGTIRDGLIKKVNKEFFYASTTHNNIDLKLFATDIINLGSIFTCDWQGIPKINDLLIPTTYKIPPDIQELNFAETAVEVCGMVDIGTPSGAAPGGLFFSVNCLGLHVSQRQCLNLRHICEMGVEIDTAQEDPVTGVILVASDCIIGQNDIDDDNGKWFRDVFYGLNYPAVPTAPPIGGYSTNFNLQNCDKYDFTEPNTSPECPSGPNNGQNYIDFRGYNAGKSAYGQTDNSYFFYFGLLPGKTGLDKMNDRYFTHCKPVTKNEMIINATTTPALSGGTGCMTFNFIGGTAPYSYTVTGVFPTSYPANAGSTTNSATICGLPIGTFLIEGFDSLGTPVSTTTVVSGPPSLYCSVVVTTGTTGAGINDGKITITSVGGGTGPYSFKYYNGAGVLLGGPTLLATPHLITGLAVDTTIGYKVVVTDSSTPVLACTHTGLKISGPTSIVAAPVTTNVTCYGGNNGSLALNISGGQSPYTILTTSSTPPFSSGAGTFPTLQAGTYTTSVVDSLGTTLSLSNTITQPAQLALVTASVLDLAKQCDQTQYIIPFKYGTGASPAELAGTSPIDFYYSIDGGGFVSYPIYLDPINPTVTLYYVNIIGMNITNKIEFRFLSAAGCASNTLGIFETSIRKPTVALAIINTPIVQQCTAGSASMSISLVRDATRTPINIEYSTNGGTTWIAAGSTSSIFYTFNATVSIGPINSSTTTSIKIRATDIKGCRNTIATSVTTPNTALHINVSTAYAYTTLGVPYYTHSVSYGGGITPLSPSIATYTDTNSSNPTATITDNVGCSA